jgi:excisionase family DNA binding protein
MSLTRKQVGLYDFLSNLSIMKSCNDLEYKEIIESIIDGLNEPRKVEHLQGLLKEFNGFSTDLKKHLMVKRDEIKKDITKKEKEQIVDDGDTIDLTEAAASLGISRPTLYKLIEGKKIRTVRKSKKKQVILKTELERYFKLH